MLYSEHYQNWSTENEIFKIPLIFFMHFANSFFFLRKKFRHATATSEWLNENPIVVMQ